MRVNMPPVLNTADGQVHWRERLGRVGAIWSATRAFGPRRALARVSRRLAHDWRRLARASQRLAEHRRYRSWLRHSRHRRIETMVGPGPRVSILMPTYRPDARWLARAVDSVRAQSYGRWELCIADDASPGTDHKDALASIRRSDPRIRFSQRGERGHISAASNSALARASGDFLALLDQDDELAPDALERVVETIRRHPDVDVVYSDEDKIDTRGGRRDPYLKPDWSPDLILSQNLVSHLGVYRASGVREVGGFRESFEGSQDHDLVLRVMERPGAHARHVAEVLYHWRLTEGSTSGDVRRKGYALTAGRRAIESHLERLGRTADVEPALVSYYRVRWALPRDPPAVAVILEEPGGVTQLGLGGGSGLGAVDVHSAGAAAGREGRAARLNQAARSVRADVLVFLGAGCALSRSGLEELVSQAARPEVGVVGGQVVSPRGRVLNGGHLLDLGAAPCVLVAHAGLHADEPGHFGRNNLVQNFSSVSADAMAIRRDVFEALNGFDAEGFPEKLCDVDLCLRAWGRGLRVVWTPWARIVDARSARLAPRGGTVPPRDLSRLRERWADRWPSDPYWHPRLDRSASDFRLRECST